jgi:hypothetical protein
MSVHLTVTEALAVGFTSGVVLTAAAAERLFTRLRSRSDGQVEQARHPAGRRLTSDERYAAAAVPARRLRVVGGDR